MGRSSDSADSRALSVYVINPDLGVLYQLLCLDPSLIQSHREVNLKSEFQRWNRFRSLRGWAAEREETHRVVAKLLTQLSDCFDVRLGGEADNVTGGQPGT